MDLPELTGTPVTVPVAGELTLAGTTRPVQADLSLVRTAEGVGVVTTGWSKGGKTEAVLAFVARGARFVGDEWVYVEHDGATVHGIPEPLRLWDWHLRQLPDLRARIGRGERARLVDVKDASSAARPTA